MPTKFVTKPPRVPRCRIRGHSDHVAGCVTCIAFSRYDYRRRQWEAHVGIEKSLVPAGPISDHVEMLINQGNWRLVDIVERSGMGMSAVQGILYRRTRNVLPVTAETLLTLQPRAARRPPMATLVPAVEAIRIARGLAAQGWSLKHMSRLAGYKYHDTFAAVASKEPEWVDESTLLNLRAVAEKLGRFDMARMDKPLPGMLTLTANMARGRGWVPLSAWAGRDIANPDAVPAGTIVPFADDDLPEVAPWSFIDPILTLRVADAADTVRKTDRRAGRRAEGFITAISHLTRIEAHAVVEYATEAGLTTPHIAELLGYSIAEDQDRQNAMRAVERMKSTVRASRAILGSLAAGEKVDPGWCFRQSGSSGGNDFVPVAAALLAMQEAPFGPGWSPAELAERAAVGEGAMRAFLTYATSRGDRKWLPVARDRRRPDGCVQKPTVAPVDLGAVLAA